MSKKNKEWNVFVKKLESINKKKREVEKEERRVLSECDHQNHKGKLKIKPIGNNDYQCKLCDQVFNMRSLTENDVQPASKVFVNLVHQIKCFSNEEDKALTRFLGEWLFNMREVIKAYYKVRDKFTKGNNKKKDRDRDRGYNDDRGRYSDRVDFYNGPKKKKSRY